MPCTDGGLSREQQMEERLDERTDMLCTVLRLVEGSAPHLIPKLPQPIQGWWDEHCDHDLRRYTRELRASLDELPAEKREAVERMIELAHRAK
jgi:hypothetical protein